ncbi:uncharacterized protein LOC143462511 isoform X1 [Clavelina lepadiformis]|uniref:uncharacterized protein LOC143462511 isoform X1 n=2 Tax=Clavelina lepadiformis TaxID=159417 RepID=UPI004041A8A5
MLFASFALCSSSSTGFWWFACTNLVNKELIPFIELGRKMTTASFQRHSAAGMFNVPVVPTQHTIPATCDNSGNWNNLMTSGQNQRRLSDRNSYCEIFQYQSEDHSTAYAVGRGNPMVNCNAVSAQYNQNGQYNLQQQIKEKNQQKQLLNQYMHWQLQENQQKNMPTMAVPQQYMQQHTAIQRQHPSYIQQQQTCLQQQQRQNVQPKQLQSYPEAQHGVQDQACSRQRQYLSPQQQPMQTSPRVAPVRYNQLQCNPPFLQGTGSVSDIRQSSDWNQQTAHPAQMNQKYINCQFAENTKAFNPVPPSCYEPTGILTPPESVLSQNCQTYTQEMENGVHHLPGYTHSVSGQFHDLSGSTEGNNSQRLAEPVYNVKTLQHTGQQKQTISGKENVNVTCEKMATQNTVPSLPLKAVKQSAKERQCPELTLLLTESPCHNSMLVNALSCKDHIKSNCQLSFPVVRTPGNMVPSPANEYQPTTHTGHLEVAVSALPGQCGSAGNNACPSNRPAKRQRSMMDQSIVDATIKKAQHELDHPKLTDVKPPEAQKSCSSPGTKKEGVNCLPLPGIKSPKRKLDVHKLPSENGKRSKPCNSINPPINLIPEKNVNMAKMIELPPSPPEEKGDRGCLKKVNCCSLDRNTHVPFVKEASDSMQSEKLVKMKSLEGAVLKLKAKRARKRNLFTDDTKHVTPFIIKTELDDSGHCANSLNKTSAMSTLGCPVILKRNIKRDHGQPCFNSRYKFFTTPSYEKRQRLITKTRKRYTTLDDSISASKRAFGYDVTSFPVKRPSSAFDNRRSVGIPSVPFTVPKSEDFKIPDAPNPSVLKKRRARISMASSKEPNLGKQFQNSLKMVRSGPSVKVEKAAYSRFDLSKHQNEAAAKIFENNLKKEILMRPCFVELCDLLHVLF